MARSLPSPGLPNQQLQFLEITERRLQQVPSSRNSRYRQANMSVLSSQAKMESSPYLLQQTVANGCNPLTFDQRVTSVQPAQTVLPPLSSWRPVQTSSKPPDGSDPNVIEPSIQLLTSVSPSARATADPLERELQNYLGSAYEALVDLREQTVDPSEFEVYLPKDGLI